MKFCVKCGVELPDAEAVFCPECGVRLPAKAAASDVKPTTPKRTASTLVPAAAEAPAAPPPATTVAAPPPAPAPPEFARVEPAEPSARPPRRGSAALWIAWSVVVLLAAGNIFQGLFFGLGWDDKETSQTTVTEMAVTTTLPTVDLNTGEEAVVAADAAAKALVRNAMTAMESAYIDVRTFDPTVMTPELLMSAEPSITFVVMLEGEADGAPTVLASNGEVMYNGSEIGYAVGTVSDSGTVFGVVYDMTAGDGGEYTYYVDDLVQDW